MTSLLTVTSLLTMTSLLTVIAIIIINSDTIINSDSNYYYYSMIPNKELKTGSHHKTPTNNKHIQKQEQKRQNKGINQQH